MRPRLATLTWISRVGAREHRVDDLRRVLGCALLERQRLPGASASFACSNSATFSSADPDVLQRLDAEALDLLVGAQEPGQVLRRVLAGLGRVVADAAEHLDAHPPLELGVGGDPLAQRRVEALAVAAPLAQPRLMVDARGAVARALASERRELAQVVHRPVDAVAQADGLERRRHHRQPPDVHRHRVGVVEQPARPGRSRACPQRCRSARGTCAGRGTRPPTPGGVADGLPQPVPGGHSRSMRVASMPPTWIMLMTKSAPSSAVPPVERRDDLRLAAEAAPTSWWAVPRATSSRSASMSCSAMRRSAGPRSGAGRRRAGG